MSQTAYISYNDDGFWAWDVGMGVFLKHLIDVAETRVATGNHDWLQPCVEHWQLNAVIADCGLHLDEDWSKEQIDVVLGMIDDACDRLEVEQSFSWEEMKSWELLDGRGVWSRGLAEFPASSAVELGRAIQALLKGELPPAPEGTWWFYGVKEGRSTIGKRDQARSGVLTARPGNCSEKA